MRGTYWGITALAAIVAGDIAASNRGEVALGLWPLPDHLGVPLYVVIIGLPVIGFVLGWAHSWLSHGPVRRDRRQQSKRAAALEAELSGLRSSAPPAPPAA